MHQWENHSESIPFYPNLSRSDIRFPTHTGYSFQYHDTFAGDPTKFKAPIPWIGVYIASASLICFIAIAADVFVGFRHKKIWFPPKFSSLNSASMILLALAMKMPMDLTTSMPQATDQLTKLSSTVLMSIAIGNFMPSLGTMDDKDIFMNITGLGILVITVVVNICIQLSTGVIQDVRVEHVLVLFLMLLLFVVLTLSGCTVATTKKHLELKYGEIHKIISSEESEQSGRLTVGELKENVKKYWMMVETGGLQFVMARSVTCSASGLICFLTALILAEAEIRLYYNVHFIAKMGSDYKWSTLAILIIQTAVVGVGVTSTSFRWLAVAKFKSLKIRSEGHKIEFKLESYWTDRLVEWKERALFLRIRGLKCRKFIQGTKDLFFDFCIKIQILIVVASKLIWLISAFFISWLLLCYQNCNKLCWKLVYENGASDNHSRPESASHVSPNYGLYVLLLEGEEELPEGILKNISDTADRLILMGKKQQPKNLVELLQKSLCFKCLAEFDSDQVLSLDSQEPPNCWALPVVTLASITIALLKTKKNKVDRLVRSVSEGLLYVSLVEKNMDPKGNLTNIRNAAYKVWLGVELYHKWLDEDLSKMALKATPSKETLEGLASLAKNIVLQFKRNKYGGHRDIPTNWPIKVIAANSMYRISKTILLDYEGSSEQTDEKLFEKLRGMIAAILGACLTNLPVFVITKSFSCTFEERENSVRLAAQLLGEIEEVLKFLQQHEIPNLTMDQVASIDEWRAKFRQENLLALHASMNDRVASGSGELPVNLELEKYYANRENPCLNSA
ncbi:NADH-ubiquinone oxidoreductase [Actinidia chinensis var. chinensis]|uniref:NADH-ubiquinone oxidoreductase n=1 Tax=Actinidia chinensis var. chinensis TaxID=1590841 RepID=A0A2R6R8X5_ACTCC|nr:NADH-ubiquinone oxidoreductase [Actinidia chinensis var. chinensis]